MYDLFSIVSIIVIVMFGEKWLVSVNWLRFKHYNYSFTCIIMLEYPMTAYCQQLDLPQLSIVHNMPTVNSHESSEIVCCLSHRFTRDTSFHVNESINCFVYKTSISIFSSRNLLIIYIFSIMDYVFVGCFHTLGIVYCHENRNMSCDENVSANTNIKIHVIATYLFASTVITIIPVGLGVSFVFIYLYYQQNVFLCTDWNVIAIG